MFVAQKINTKIIDIYCFFCRIERTHLRKQILNFLNILVILMILLVMLTTQNKPPIRQASSYIQCTKQFGTSPWYIRAQCNIYMNDKDSMLDRVISSFTKACSVPCLQWDLGAHMFVGELAVCVYMDSLLIKAIVQYLKLSVASPTSMCFTKYVYLSVACNIPLFTHSHIFEF